MKKYILISIFASISFISYSQNDSTSFVNGNWEKRKINDAITLTQCHFIDNSLFKSNQYISVMIVSNCRFDIVAAPEGSLKKTSDMAAENGAVAAVNGSFYNTSPNYNSVNYLRIDGVEIDPNNGKKRTSRQNGAIATFNGDLYVLKGDNVKDWESYIEAEDVLTSGPMLMAGGVNLEQEVSSFNTTRHPRTAVGRTPDGKIILVTVDGRTPQSAGVSMWECQHIMSWLGCESSINLDGGGSTTMVIEGSVVNNPCDNKKFDNAGERRVQNCLIISVK